MRGRESLPPFSGAAVRCPKCGTGGVKVTWHVLGGMTGEPCVYTSYSQHLCRACHCCGYGWMEATKDSENREPLRAIGGTGQ